MLDRIPRPPRIVRRMFAAYFAVMTGAGVSAAMRAAPDWANIVALVATTLILGCLAELLALLIERPADPRIQQVRGAALDRYLAILGMERHAGESDRSARARVRAAMVGQRTVTRTAVPYRRDEP